jgi:hypothetical protein
MEKFNFDASILQFTPKGSYYNTESEQNQKITEQWKEFLQYDRLLFALILFLPTSDYAFGRISHLLCKNKTTEIVSKDFKITNDFEEKIILNGLRKQPMPRALKNLLMFTNANIGRVNNAKVRNIILKYIFQRDLNSLDSMCCNFKDKIKLLLKHVYGKKIWRVLNGRNLFGITNVHERALDVLKFCFNKSFDTKDLNMMNAYICLREYAKENRLDSFLDLAKKSKMNIEILIGFKALYKLNIDLSEIYDAGNMSEKQKIQKVRAVERTGTKQDINYKNYDIYDLYKMFYVKLTNNETNDMDLIAEAIEFQSNKKMDIDLGEIVVIMDASKSMIGSETRPYHPFLTGLSLVSKLPNVKDVMFVGGEYVDTYSNNMPKAIVPSGATKIWESLIQAVNKYPDTIVLISDGYENNVKGLTNQIYEKLKKEGKEFNIIHINPVFAAETGNARRLIKEIKPFIIENYRMIKTNLIFQLIMDNKELAIKMLFNEYKKLEVKELKRLKG